MTARTVDIIIPTHQRNVLLLATLESIGRVARDSVQVSVCVIDNSARGEAARVIPHQIGDIAVRYVHEPSPGLSAARNRGLREADRSADFIAWVDDDELVTTYWLRNLIDTAEKCSASVVAGPVLPLFDTTTPKWLVRGGHWQRRRHATGTILEEAASGNVLIQSATLIRNDDILFDESLNFSGGEDKDYFRQLAARGESIVWCDEAPVREHVLPERARVGWLFQRAVRIGRINATYWIRDRGSARVVAGGAIRTVLGFSLCALDMMVHRTWPRARYLNMFGHGVGMWQCLFGFSGNAYRRKSDQG